MSSELWGVLFLVLVVCQVAELCSKGASFAILLCLSFRPCVNLVFEAIPVHFSLVCALFHKAPLYALPVYLLLHCSKSSVRTHWLTWLKAQGLPLVSSHVSGLCVCIIESKSRQGWSPSCATCVLQFQCEPVWGLTANWSLSSRINLKLSQETIESLVAPIHFAHG